jgi:hypothetical protein
MAPSEPDPLARIRDAAKNNVQACSATGENLCEQVAPKIIANARGDSPIAENLRKLTEDVGGRVTGTPAAKRAVAWGVAAFRDAGVDVHTETYTIPITWSEGASRIAILSAQPFPVRLVSVAWAPATPSGGIEAPVVLAGEGTEGDFAKLGGSAKGSILLVHSKVLKTWDDLFEEYINAPGIIQRAKAAGAPAILWMSSREGSLLYRHTNSLTGKIDILPQAILARDDALRLDRSPQAKPFACDSISPTASAARRSRKTWWRRFAGAKSPTSGCCSARISTPGSWARARSTTGATRRWWWKRRATSSAPESAPAAPFASRFSPARSRACSAPGRT